MNYLNDFEYIEIVQDILDSSELKKLANLKHHGITRLDHVIKVSYKAYQKSKKKKLDYVSVARAGLLHDLFHEDYKKLSFIKRIKLLVKHPKYALSNAKKAFKINKLEEDIIISHMFPIGLRMPRHRESWIVNIIDDMASISDRIKWIGKIFKK